MQNVLRVGDVSKLSPTVAPFALGGCRWPVTVAADVAAAMAAAKVVGVTCFGCCHAALARARFGVAIIDEAGQARCWGPELCPPTRRPSAAPAAVTKLCALAPKHAALRLRPRRAAAR